VLWIYGPGVMSTADLKFIGYRLLNMDTVISLPHV
jgi:hypothetical protein